MAVPTRIFILILITGIVTSTGCTVFAPATGVVADYDRLREKDLAWEAKSRQHRSLPENGRQLAASPMTRTGSNGDTGQTDLRLSVQGEPERNEDREDFSLTSLSPGRFSGTMKQLIGNGPSRDRAQELFAQAEAKYAQALSQNGSDRRKTFLKASDDFKKASSSWPDSALHEDALFMHGESQFFADRYPAAEDAFAELIEHHPNTRYLDIVDARRFEISRYWLAKHRERPRGLLRPNFFDRTRPRIDSFGHAVKLFDQIRMDDPTGKLADDATMAAANAYFEAGKYRKADVLYSDLRESFPSSEHQFQAHLLGLKCKLLIYQGPEYDDTPLKEAEKLAEQIRRQFRSEYQKERDYVDRAHAEVRAHLAQQDWYKAKYYERRKEFGGARHYFERVAQGYPTTKAAEAARGQLAQLEDEMDSGSSQVSWLTDIFRPPDRQPILTASEKSAPSSELR